MQKFVGVGVVREFHVLTVPYELLSAVMNANAAEQHRFRQRTGEIKIGSRGAIAFARFEPFLMMADGSRQGLRRALVFLVQACGKQPRMLAAPAGEQHLAFIADENNPVFWAALTALF